MDLNKLNLTELSAGEKVTTQGGGGFLVGVGIALTMYMVMNWAQVEDGWGSMGGNVSY
jgi:uncharacterized membrane protein YidH (DUF202 family)